MPKIDAVADLGKSFGVWTMGADEAILDLLTSTNVACGFHAGMLVPSRTGPAVGRCPNATSASGDVVVRGRRHGCPRASGIGAPDETVSLHQHVGELDQR